MDGSLRLLPRQQRQRRHYIREDHVSSTTGHAAERYAADVQRRTLLHLQKRRQAERDARFRDAGDNHQDSWKLVAFIRHLPSLSQGESLEMEKLNPKSPQEIEEEQQEDNFLQGGPAPSQPPAAHHHRKETPSSAGF